MERTIAQLVDELPTESLDIFVARYEAKEVGGYFDSGIPLRRDGRMNPSSKVCPRCALGFHFKAEDFPIQHHGYRGVLTHDEHPARLIELRALNAKFNLTELYNECVLALASRSPHDQTGIAATEKELPHESTSPPHAGELAATARLPRAGRSAGNRERTRDAALVLPERDPA